MTTKQLITQIKKKKSFLCIGLDVDLNKIPKHLLNDEEISDEIKQNPNVVYLRFMKNLPFEEVLGKQWILSPNGDFKEAAANLFHYLRELDRSQADFIIAQTAPNSGLGLAINDRLFRASKKI